LILSSVLKACSDVNCLIMSLLLFAYGLYLLMVLGIIRWVGVELHRVGATFIRHFVPEEKTGRQLNNLLLLGYYLFNAGYSILVLTQGNEQIQDPVSAYEWVTYRLGLILLILGGLHVNNMALIYLYFSRKKSSLPA